MNFRNHLIIVFCSLLGISSMAQNYSAKVIDTKTGEPIPFATVQTGKNQGVITNEEGIFSFIINEERIKPDSIYISSMGYERISVSLNESLDEVIYLNQKPFELSEVFLSNKEFSVEEIIEKVKERIDENYTTDLTKKKMFFRESEFNNMKKFDFVFKKSTIEEFNKEFMDSISRIIPKNSSYYKEAIGNFYGDYEKYKLNINRAAELYDKSKEVSFDGVEKKMERIFKENVKPDSYLKIK